MLSKQQLLWGAGGAVITLALGASAITFAQTSTTSSSTTGSSTPMMRMHMPGVGGTVTAVNGSTVTITGKDGTTYTVNAGSASITKDETITVSDIKVGDTVMAGGTVNGTTVTATNIHDGNMPMGLGWKGPGHGRPNDNDADDATTAPAANTTTTQ